MSENDDVDRLSEAPHSFGKILTPKATAIAALAFAVFSMQGQGTWSQTVQALVWNGGNFPQSQLSYVLASWAVATLLLACVAWLLARRTLRDAVAAGSWEGHLARAAMIVAAAGALLSVVAILAGAVRGSG
jgi:hypothetical protein